MMDPGDEFIEIARIGQAHGLTGMVRVHLHNPETGFPGEEDIVFLRNRRGDLFPARIEEIRVQNKRNRNEFFVKFDRIANRTDAVPFKDTPIYSERSADRPVSSQRDETVIGYRVLDESEPVGHVADVMETPAHPLLEIESEEDSGNRSFLVPWVEHYVQSVDYPNRTLHCRNLDSLKSL